MTTRRRRMSRALIAALAIILALGLIFWLHNIDKNKAVRNALQASSQVQSSPVQPAMLTPEKPVHQPLVLQTPTTATAATPSIASSAKEIPTLAAATTAPAFQAVTERREVADSAASKTAQKTPEKTDKAAPTTAPAPRLAAATISPNKPASLDDAFVCGTTIATQSYELVEARRTLNAAIIDGSLSPADLAKAKQKLNEINAVLVFSSRHINGDEFGGTYEVPSGAVLEKIAKSHEVTTELLQRINGINDPRKLRAGQGIKVLKGPFHAAVYKKDFRLELWLGAPNEKGSMYITSFPVGLGKDDSTPTGAWAVGTKLKNPAYYSPRGEGVIAPDDPNNPLGEVWISLTGTDGQAIGKTSYGIHGTIHPESIGKQESMGCIRLKNEDAVQVYEMLIEGQSTVVVRE